MARMNSGALEFLVSMGANPTEKAKKERIVILFRVGKLQTSEFVDLFFSDDLRISHKAGWIIQLLAEFAPEYLLPYIPLFIEQLNNPSHDAYVRNTMRAFQDLPLQEEYEGTLYDIAFAYLTDPKSAIAIKVFSMSVLRKIAIKYEGLIEELIAAIEVEIPHGSSGFKNRAAKELHVLRKALPY